MYLPSKKKTPSQLHYFVNFRWLLCDHLIVPIKVSYYCGKIELEFLTLNLVSLLGSKGSKYVLGPTPLV